MKLPSIYLASGSPRRRELLSQIGVQFDVLSVSVDESVLAGELAADYVQRVAVDKAKAGLSLLQSRSDLVYRPILAADTAVIVDDTIFGKPTDDEQAKTFLQQLSGRQHQVLSSVVLATNKNITVRCQLNQVRFANLSGADIEWYIATGEGRDKAGSYAVQGLAAQFIEHIDGSFSGIMGLPLFETRQLLQECLADEQ
ncbi:Maf family protein [Methylophaga sp. OBS3]|uniref:Maf family protein n=1 Tax=Methylophaga sp. OBS3 TaxID=2991934 RepID=UPI00225B85CE|nr:Maf family protein [Methylophaga sp. OBS3]MCX4190105.1 Maf family nucleotide pyrophosphatase [Methylophaga sp. OBS3]